MKKIALFLITALMSITGWAQSISTRNAGEVRVDCDGLNWNFKLSTTYENGREYLKIEMDGYEEAVPSPFTVSFAVPQNDAHHLWSVNGTSRFQIKPDWAASYKSSISSGMPLYQFLNDSNRNRLTIAMSEVFDEVVAEVGLREEGCLLCGHIKYFTAPHAPLSHYETVICFDSRNLFWAKSIQEASAWMSEASGCKPCQVPEAATDPLYSSWYQFHQDVHAGDIEAECKLASELGMRTIIVDDGWQTEDTSRGYAFCGDWEVVESRFPNMWDHVDQVHRMGMKYMLWYSVPYVGIHSKAYERFKDKALKVNDGGNVLVLDPRFPEVREYLLNLYVKAMNDWGLDGFKLDFIDQFRLTGTDPDIAQNYAGRDFKSVPDAVNKLMSDIQSELHEMNPEVLLEFRQSYIGPAIRQYGNMLRVSDCPGDLQANRIGIANLRLTSGATAVHSDMIEWSSAESPENAGRAILSALFGTIQYSVMLRDISQAHRNVIKHWIDFSQKHRETLLHSDFYPSHPEAGYPTIEAANDKEWIIAAYQDDIVVDVASCDRDTYIINATGANAVYVSLDKSPSKVEAFDTYGRSVKAPAVKKGISRIEIPVSGYIKLHF